MVMADENREYGSMYKGVEDVRQDLGDEACPIARNAAVLGELDVAEEKVAELLELAAGALDGLATISLTHNENIELSTKRFLGLVSSLHRCLSSKANLIRDYTPYSRSIYGPRKELELLHEKARFLRSELARMDAEIPDAASSSTSVSSFVGMEAADDMPKDDEAAFGFLSEASATAANASGASDVVLSEDLEHTAYPLSG